MGVRNFISTYKLQIGIILVIISFILGFVSKLPFFELLRNPGSFNDNSKFYVASIVIYLLSWVMVIIGIVLLGKKYFETVQTKMKKNVRKTYQRSVQKPMKLHIHKPVKKIMRRVGAKGLKFEDRFKRVVRRQVNGRLKEHIKKPIKRFVKKVRKGIKQQ